MTQRFIVAGTDTDVGKTVFAAALVGALQACYWKPVQCGLEGETDSAGRCASVGRAGASHPARGLSPQHARIAASRR